MLRKPILVLVAAIAVGIVALAGIAVAEMATDDTGAPTVDALVVRSTTTMVDDGALAPTGTTTTTMVDDDGAPAPTGTTATTMVDDDGAPAPTGTTTTTMVDDDEYDDDEYDDDEYDDEYDDDEYDDEYDDDEYDDDEYDDYQSIADGFETIDVSPAGSITVEVRSGRLYLTSMDIDSSWMLAKRDEQSEQFELLFYWGESELKIKVEIDSGFLKKMVEFDMKHD